MSAATHGASVQSSKGDPLLAKLEAFGALPEEDRALVVRLTGPGRTVPAYHDIIQEGDRPQSLNLILEGFACRYKLLEDGTRQIVAFLLPGDFCDLHVFILREMDHSICTISPVRMVQIPRDDVLTLLSRPAVARALWWVTLVDEATLREWLVNMGRREAEARIAHLLCELHLRLTVVGLAQDGRFAMPITQAEIGDALGLSAIHVNRSIQKLREQGLLTLKYREVVIDNVERLRAAADFKPNYLHLTGGKTDPS